MNMIRLLTLTRKEILRFAKVWTQTIVSPIVIALLYFAVFGGALSSEINTILGISYLAFVVPGLALMQGTNNAYQNSSSSLIIAKYHGTVNDLLISPLNAMEKTLAYTLGGVVRGVLVTLLVWGIGIFFVDGLFPQHFLIFLFVLFFSNAIFAIMGILAGLWSKTFDHSAGISTFLITPMGFLGAVFYSIEMLPNWAQKISMCNPFLYMVDLMRFSLFGISEIDPIFSMVIIFTIFLMLFSISFVLFQRNWKLKK